MGEINKDDIEPNELLRVCDCYPDHCTHGDTCWCEPELEIVNDIKIIVHKEAN